MKAKFIICLAGLLLGAGLTFAWNAATGTTGHTDSILASGNPTDAEVRLKQLMGHLRSVNGDWNQIAFNEQQLPDQHLSGNKAYRSPNTAVVSHCDAALYTGQVLFYTDLYTEEDFTHLGNDRTRVERRGFYIVGWSDGRVERVPIDSVKLHPGVMKSGRTGLAPVFPGMTQYASGTKIPSGPEDFEK